MSILGALCLIQSTLMYSRFRRLDRVDRRHDGWEYNLLLELKQDRFLEQVRRRDQEALAAVQMLSHAEAQQQRRVERQNRETMREEDTFVFGNF